MFLKISLVFLIKFFSGLTKQCAYLFTGSFGVKDKIFR